MKTLFIIFISILLLGCDQDRPHNFKDNDKVTIADKYDGVIYIAKSWTHKVEFVRVEWIDDKGLLHDEWVHYQLLKAR